MRQRNPIFHMLFEKYIDSTGLTQERRAEQGELCGRGYGLRGGVMSEELGVMGKPAAVFPAGLVELAAHGTALYSAGVRLPSTCDKTLGEPPQSPHRSTNGGKHRSPHSRVPIVGSTAAPFLLDVAGEAPEEAGEIG